jgi:uncharacterized membrane protein (DUF2068 family)
LVKPQARRGLGLTLIAVGKLIQVLLVLSVGATALVFAKHVPPATLREWADAFEPQSAWVQGMLDKLVSLSGDKLTFIGRTSLAYASLFTVEGVGLWRNKRWAEYLTVIVTTSFLPFELRALIHDFNVAKLAALTINGAIVAYLSIRLVRDRKAAKT